MVRLTRTGRMRGGTDPRTIGIDMGKRGTAVVTWSVTLHSASGRRWTYELETDAKTPASEVSRAAWVWHERQGGAAIDPAKTEVERA